MIAPEIFELSDIDGHSSAIDPDVPADQEARVADAVRTCPERAISTS
jgi:ferredoxin